MEKQALIQQLQRIKTSSSNFSGTAGFDAVVDQVAHVIRSISPNQKKTYFRTITEFSDYIRSKAGLSGSLELETVREKVGGNMAIYSNALGRLGVTMHCIGSFGNPIGDVFSDMDPHCTCYGICEPGFCQALEFDDGKIMLASMEKLCQITWNRLETQIGQDALLQWTAQDHVIALLNWSELAGSTALFRTFYQKLLEQQPMDKHKYLFVDISDASRRQMADIQEVLPLFRQFSKRRAVVLSVNENECRLLGKAAGIFCADLEEQARQLREQAGVDYLVLHLMDRAMAFTSAGTAIRPGYYVERPLFSTGGGDNFNAGFTFGLLSGLSVEDCLSLGNAVSGYYVRQGESPDLEQVIQFLDSQQKEGRVC